jgi:two-component sensor histidine kinase
LAAPALVFHELLFNAMLHGAHSGPSGAVAVSWVRTADHGGFELSWVETNASARPAARRSGFGTMMMQAVIKKQLSGKIGGRG